jgi:hypothetical protein
MFDEATASIGGEAATKAPKPLSRAQRVENWREAHRAAYKAACDDHCTCTPTRAQMLLMDQWKNPPID